MGKFNNAMRKILSVSKKDLSRNKTVRLFAYCALLKN